MKRIKTHILRRCFAFLMAVIVLTGTAITSPMTAHAADGTLNFQTGELIAYGDYYTTKMSVDNNGTAYCVQPMKKTPAAAAISTTCWEKTLRFARRSTTCPAVTAMKSRTSPAPI